MIKNQIIKIVECFTSVIIQNFLILFIDSTIFQVPENKTKYSSSSFDSSRQEPLEVGPDILQNCDKRLPQSPNITFYSFLFLRSRYFAVSFLSLSSFASVLFDWSRVFFEKRYHDIPAVSILHLLLFFHPFFSRVSIFFSPHRRPSSPSQHSFSRFCPLLFLPLSFSCPALFIFHFLVSLPSMFTIRKISTTFNISYLIISTL